MEAPITEFRELETPVSLARLRAVEPALRGIRDELATSDGGAIYFPYAFSDKRPLRPAQGYLLKFPAALLDVVPELNVARKPAMPSIVGAGGKVSKSPRQGTGGTGRQQDVDVRRAIEQHAVAATMAHLEGLGCLVENVGSTESYDVFALTDWDEIHVEVKGSSTIDAIAVELTDGEVKHWGPSYRRLLAVVDGITWEKKGETVQTDGGRLRIWDDWKLDADDNSLVPIRYRYTLPAGAHSPPSA